jgi:enoyl-CoA hydratase
MYTNLVLDKKDKIAILTIDRPKQLNALNKETIASLNKALSDLNKDDSIRVIILTGSGEKAFVAGADIKEFQDFNPDQGRELAAKGQEILFDFIEGMKKPVIAAVNGYALGGGLELAMACHIRIASDNALVGLPEVTLGLIPGYGGTQRLTHLVGKGLAMEMILSAGMIKSDKALASGLFNKVVPQPELLATCQKLGEKIASNSGYAIGKAIESVNASTLGKKGFAIEINNFGDCFGTEDFKEGTKAFMEKRKPDFN